MNYDHWKATEPDLELGLSPAEEAELDWQAQEDERNARFDSMTASESLAFLYDRAHQFCKDRDRVCHECNHYPPPEALY